MRTLSNARITALCMYTNGINVKMVLAVVTVGLVIRSKLYT